jgi:hypothetical protein
MAEITQVQPEEASKPEESKSEQEVGLNLRPDVEFKLPDNRLVRMGKPPRPTALLMPAIMAGMLGDPNDKEKRPVDGLRSEFNARMALFVRSINGVPTILPHTAGEVDVLLQTLGEDGCDLAFDVYLKHFAPLNSDKLVVVKK